MGDGTFGRALQCVDVQTGRSYAVKVIRSVKRYIESAQTEARYLREIRDKRGCENGIVLMHENFTITKSDG